LDASGFELGVHHGPGKRIRRRAQVETLEVVAPLRGLRDELDDRRGEAAFIKGRDGVDLPEHQLGARGVEREARAAKDVTIYTFLYPILGADSTDKSRNIWCAKDRGKVWADWMIDGALPPKVMGECDVSALQRNAALGRKHKINGTPALVFEDGKRVPGAMTLDDLEKQLLASAKKPG
jgi:hypothetical protein